MRQILQLSSASSLFYKYIPSRRKTPRLAPDSGRRREGQQLPGTHGSFFPSLPTRSSPIPLSPAMVACPSQTTCALAAAAARTLALRCVPIPHALCPCVSVGRCCPWQARWLGLSRASPSPVSSRVPLVSSARAGKCAAKLLGAAASNPAWPAAHGQRDQHSVAAPSPPLSPCTAARPLPAC